jgi:chondroitin AC lyase
MKYKFTLMFLIFFSLSLIKTTAGEKEQIIARDNYLKYYFSIPEGSTDKVAAVQQFRDYFSKTSYRLYTLKTSINTWKGCFESLNADGIFKDMQKQEEKILSNDMLGKSFGSTDNEVANFLTEAYNRIWTIAEAYRKGETTDEIMFAPALLKAIVHYGKLEAGRPNNGARFHSSCFAMPTAAVNIYFAMLHKMNEVESGVVNDALLKETSEMLKIIGLQAWTQPLRNDETDKNIVQIERFRNHVWWVGGNALAYRSLLPVAFMFKSVPMVDLLSEVCQKAMSTTSQNTWETSFWTEGFTADGAGWGHGKQCLIWGYPIDGTSNALAVLSILKGSPWAKNLSDENINALMNFFRGSNWYYYKGFTLPCLDRNSMQYNPTPKAIRTQAMARTILKDWKSSFSAAQQAEITQLVLEANSNNINLSNYPAGTYSGTRWFFNNDDLIKKNERYHIIVNMASVRCDGLESAPEMADAYNFFSADGLTLFQKSGDEYRKIIGAWDVTASPGVTAREGMEKITPVTNWRGYCSKHNFAGAATYGGENTVAGYVFEKMNGSEKADVNDKGTSNQQNREIYGVKAHKAWFMLGDYTIALGAGITNLQPGMEGNIRTTIDQTASEGKISLFAAGKPLKMKKGTQSMLHNGKPVWVQQKDKFAYTVLPEYTKDASFITEKKDADWVKMNKSNQHITNLPAVADILRLWVNHGQKPENETYGYVVYAGNENPPSEFPFTVLKNDTTLQAVQSADQKIVEAVFYKAGSLIGPGVFLTVSDPCVLLFESNDSHYSIAVQDPAMNKNLKQITLSIGRKKYSIDLPQGEFAGLPAVIKIAK